MLKPLIGYLLAYYEIQQPQLQLQHQHQQQPNGITDKRAAKLYNPQLKCSIALLNLLQKDEPNKSIFYSSHSVYTTLFDIGSTASASTMLGVQMSDLRGRFECDHPFLFVIHDSKFNEILFAGIYRGPNVNQNNWDNLSLKPNFRNRILIDYFFSLTLKNGIRIQIKLKVSISLNIFVLP